MKHFTKISVLTVAMGLFFAITLNAALISYDGFDYADGANLNNQSGGTGWADDWDGSNDNDIDVPGLSYTNGVRHLIVNGNCVLTGDGSTSHTWRYADTNSFMDSCLLTANGWCFGKAGTTNWLSFIAKQMDDNNQFGGVSFHEGGSWGGNERIFVGKSSGGSFNWRLTGGGNSSYYGDVATTNDTPALLVLRVINFANLDNTNTMDLWINPDLASEPVGNGNLHHTKCDSTLFNRIRVASGTSAFKIDEVRLGETWSDVVPVIPEPTIFALISMVIIGLIRRK